MFSAKSETDISQYYTCENVLTITSNNILYNMSHIFTYSKKEHTEKISENGGGCCFVFMGFFFCLFRVTPEAYGGS